MIVLFLGMAAFTLADEKPLELAGHAGGAIAVAASSDGKTAATAASDGIIRFWDLTSGKEIRRVTAGDNGRRLGHLAFTPDGKSLLASGPEVDLVQYGAKSLLIEKAFGAHPHGYMALGVSGNGKLVATGHKNTIDVWERATGKVVTYFGAHSGVVGGLSFSPDGRMLASAGPDGKARLWEPTTGKMLGEFPGSAPWAVAFDPRGYAIVSVGASHEAILSEIATKQVRRRLETEQGAAVSFLAMSSEGGTIAAGCQDGSVHLFSASTGKKLAKLAKQQSMVESLAFTADGKRLLAVGRGEGSVLVWDVPAAAPLKPVPNADQLWKSLESKDASKAFDAILGLAAMPEKSLPLLRDPGKTAPADAARIAKLIADLDSDRFALRRRAAADLEKQLHTAAPQLRKALENPSSVEAQRAIERLLAQLEGSPDSPELVRSLRMIEVLDRIGNAESRKLLEGMTRGSDDSRIARAAKAALGR